MDGGFSVALIDGDPLVYRAAFSVQKNMYIIEKEGEPIFASSRKKEVDDFIADNNITGASVESRTFLEDDAEKKVLYNLRSMLEAIIEATETNQYRLFLTGKGNFREDLDGSYKEGRAERPKLYTFAREALEGDIMTDVIHGMEADDALAIEQCRREDSVICSIDKDLLMIPGWHYNPVKDAFKYVTYSEGLLFFYKQILTGDRVDNIEGLAGIGPKRAEKILAEFADKDLKDKEVEKEVWNTVVSAYEEKGRTREDAVRNARLLWMVRELDEEGNPVMWNPPDGGEDD